MIIKKYLEDITPSNILDLLDETVVQSLLNGYSFALDCGICLLYPNPDSQASEPFRRINAHGARLHEVFQPMCAEWRDEDGCGQDQACVAADASIARIHQIDSVGRLRIFRCEPLGLWDMTYPLRVEGSLVGVLFAGQMIVDAGPLRWAEVLADHREVVDWQSCPPEDDHVHTVLRRIDALQLPQADRDSLRNLLEDVQRRDRIVVSREGFLNRIGEFQKFAEMTQALLLEMHKVRRTAAEQELLRDCSNRLEAIDLADRGQWAIKCKNILDALMTFPGIHRMELYVRKKARFQRLIPPLLDSAGHILAREVISEFPHSVLTPTTQVKLNPDPNTSPLQGSVVMGYYSETGWGRDAASSLLLIEGVIPHTDRDFWDRLAATVCRATDEAMLIFREREADEQYRHKVKLIGHSFRTPLQAIQMLLNRLRASPSVQQHTDLKIIADQVMDRVYDASEDLRRLLDTDGEESMEFDFVALMSQVLEAVEPLAREHHCIIVRKGKWPESVLVRGERYYVQRALINLADNAVKYSYVGNRRDGRPFEVRVALEDQHQYVKAIFSNYGIGIPKNMLERITEYGYRAEIADSKTPRPGMGLGLPFAADTFSGLGGWVHVDSVPTHSAEKNPETNYHRYVTIVEAALPIIRRN